MERIRETRILAASQLNSATGKLATVLTYKTRRPPVSTWTYTTAVIGYRGDMARGWLQSWSDEQAALRGHHDTCDKIYRDQGMTLQ
jgi:hypothetical protein